MQLSEVAQFESVMGVQNGNPDHVSTNFEERGLRDQQLILKVQSGDAEAFYTLIQPYLRIMRYVVRPMVPNAADAEDIVQDAVIRAFTKLPQLRSFRSFRAWLLQIAVNEGRMKRRSFLRARTESLSEILSTDDNGAREESICLDNRKMPLFEAETRQVREHLRTALASLPPMYREVFVLLEVQELTVEETARLLRLKPATLRTRLRRARTMLRKKLLALWNSKRPRGPGSLVLRLA